MADESDYLEHTSGSADQTNHDSPTKTDTSAENKSGLTSTESETKTDVQTPIKEDLPNKNSDTTTLKVSDKGNQNEDGKPLEHNDKLDGVYLHRPAPDKMQRVNQPEDDGPCMDCIYSTLTCLDNCAVL